MNQAHVKRSSSAKPVLIIGCSDKKASDRAMAFELYQGAMYQLLNANLSSPMDTFEILILSAKLGLIRATEFISPYDQKMVSRQNSAGIKAFAAKHGSSAIKLIKSVANRDRDLYVALSNDYLCALDACMGSKSADILKRFRSHYISRGHTGIGDLRGRVCRIIKAVADPEPLNPVWLHSGLANMSEIGFLSAGCAVGASLARTNTTRGTDLLFTLLESAKHQPFFLDNGLISNLNQGKDIDHDWVFSEYEAIISSCTKQQAANVSIVVPDDVTCNEKALAIVRKHKRTIKNLANRADLILPIHRSVDIRKHAMKMLAELNYHPNIRLGVPCLSEKGKDLMLSLEDIDALLSLKNPKTGNKCFRKIHFFGMSEVTHRAKLQPRLTLAYLHGMRGTQVALDCSRVTANFGKTKTGLRKGSAIAKKLKEEHVRKQVVKSNAFVSHCFYEEYRAPNGEAFVTQDFYDMINEDEIHTFWMIYNEIMKDHAHLKMTPFPVGEESEAMEIAWQLTSNHVVDNLVFERLKNRNWEYFKHQVDSISEMSAFDVRCNAIQALFQRENTPSQPVQLAIPLAS